MTDWLAVGAGVVAGLVAGVVFSVVPGLGGIAAGLVAGGTAGMFTTGSTGEGAWNGLLAGMAWALAGAALMLVFSGVSLLTLQPMGALAGVGSAGLIVVLGAVTAVDSAIGGAVGAALS
jgi:hypothetical protein